MMTSQPHTIIVVGWNLFNVHSIMIRVLVAACMPWWMELLSFRSIREFCTWKVNKTKGTKRTNELCDDGDDQLQSWAKNEKNDVNVPRPIVGLTPPRHFFGQWWRNSWHSHYLNAYYAVLLLGLGIGMITVLRDVSSLTFTSNYLMQKTAAFWFRFMTGKRERNSGTGTCTHVCMNECHGHLYLFSEHELE